MANLQQTRVFQDGYTERVPSTDLAAAASKVHSNGDLNLLPQVACPEATSLSRNFVQPELVRKRQYPFLSY